MQRGGRRLPEALFELAKDEDDGVAESCCESCDGDEVMDGLCGLGGTLGNDESTERERALGVCLELLDTCDEVRAFGGPVTAGMKREIEHALARGLPVHFEREVAR